MTIMECLIKKGYEKESAEKLILDYLEASKNVREEYLKRYIGKRVRADFSGLLFEVIVKDVKIDTNGKVQFQISPLNGDKHTWVDRIIN